MGEFDEFDSPPAPAAATSADGEFSEFDAAPAAPARSFWQRAYDAAADVPGKVADSFANLGHTAASAVRGAVDLVSPISKEGGFQVPFGQLANPAYRHQLERGISDTVTGGLAEKAANAIDKANPLHLPPSVAGSFEANAPAEAKAEPDARALGQVGGTFLPSPFNYAAGEAAKLVPGTGPLAAAGKGLAGYEAAAVPQAAIAAPSGHRLEAAREAATDPAGLVASTATAIPATVEVLKRKLGAAADHAPDVQEAAKRRAVKDLGKDITSAEGPKARVTDQKRIAEVNDRLYDLADQNPELRQAFSEPAEKALPKVRAFKAALAQPLDRLYDAIDEKTGGGLDPRQVVGELRDMAKEAGSSVSGLGDAKRMNDIADQFEQVYITERKPPAPNEAPAARPLAEGEPPKHSEPEFDSSDGGYYHVGLKQIDRIGPDLSLAESPEEAIPYINGNKGVIHRVELSPGAKIAGEKAIRAAAEDLGVESGYVFEMADNPKVRAALREDGFDAIKYTDMGPDNAYEHETVRLLNPDAAKITSRGSVSDGEIVAPVPAHGETETAGRSSPLATLEQLRELRKTAKGVSAVAIDAQIAKLESELPAVATATDTAQKIPTRVFRDEVTALLKKSDSVMGGIEGTPRFEALQKLYDGGKRIIDKHIDGSGLPKEQIAQIRDINNGYFLLSRAEQAIESRGFKEANKPGFKFPHSIQQAVHGGGLGAIATAAALAGPHAAVHALPYVAGATLATHVVPKIAKNVNWSLAHGSYGRAVARLTDLARRIPAPEFIEHATRAGLSAQAARRIYQAANQGQGASP